MAGDLQGREGTDTYDDEDIVVEHEFSVEDLQSPVQEREACNMESAAVEGTAFDGLMIEVKEEEDTHVATAVGSVELALEEEGDINLQQQPQTVSVQESREHPYEKASSGVEATDAQEKNLDDAPMHNRCGVAAMLSRDHHLQEVGREQLEDCANVTEIEPRTGSEEEALLGGEAAASPGAPPPSEGVIETKDGVGLLKGEEKKPVHEDDDAIIMAATCEVEEEDDDRAAAVAAAAEDDGIALLPMDTSQKTIATTTSDQGSKEAMALFTEAMTGGGALQVNAAGGEEQSDSEGGLDSWEIKQRKSESACNTKLTLGQPVVTTSELVVDDLPVISMVAPTDLITAVTTYGDSVAAREEVLLSGGFQHGPQQVVDEHQLHVDTDKHLEQAQIHAQETMATATAVLAQSQLVWARIHSQHPSDLGAAREVQIASLAATVAAAASVAKAAVEAARAIGAASSNVVAPSQSLPFRAAQATSNEHPQQNTNRAIIEIRQNVEALESVVQAAGFAAQAATQGAVMAIGNPLKQATRMANYWKRKVAEMEGDANPKGRKNQSHKKTKLAKSRGVGEIFSGKKTPKKQALWTQSSPGTTPLKKLKGKEGLYHTGSSPVTMPKKMKDKQALHTRSSPVTTTPKKMKDNKQALHCSGSSPRTTPKKKKEKNVSSSSSSKREVFIKGKAVEQGKKAGDVGKSQSKKNAAAAAAAKKQKKKMTAMPEMTPRYAALQLAGVATTQSPDLRELVTRNNTPEVISEGSVVEVRAVSGVLHSHHRPLSPLSPYMHNKMEVMSEEEGLRGGWFSAKVLTLTKTEALVVYDELLTDDGSSNLKEWFPLKDSVVGNGILRRMRPVHPFVFIKDGGSRARRRVALGSQIWSVGDHVDAFLQDGWWEGVVKDVKDMDENKITLYFPGEDDTAVVKTWNVRPSLTWKDGVWGPWTGSGKDEGGQFAKQQKYESSPNVKGKKLTKKRKLLELREDAPEADSPPRSVPRLLPEGNTLSSVSHAHHKLAEVSNALSTPPKHRLSSAAAATVTIPKSTKKKLKAPEPGVPMTRQQSAADSDEHQRPRNPKLPTPRRCLERA